MTRTADADAAFAALRAADPDLMERDELAALTRLIAAHRAWCEALQVRVNRRQRQLAAEGRAESPKDLLAREGGQSGKDARTGDEREKVCSSLPQFEDALASGVVSAGHVDAIASAIRNLDDSVTAEFLAHSEGLLADAERMGVDTFDRNCRDLARHLNAVHTGLASLRTATSASTTAPSTISCRGSSAGPRICRTWPPCVRRASTTIRFTKAVGS
jgi:hypothetical protein